MSVLNQDPHGRGLAQSPEFFGDEEEFDIDEAFERRPEEPRPAGPFANDDDPRFSAYWRQAARPEPMPTQRDVLYGVLVGIATAIVVGILGFFVPSAIGAAGTPVSILTILIPSVGLGLLSIIMARLNRLSIAVDRTSRKIEIAQHAIAELDSVRTTFQNEVAFVNQALQINRNFISTRLNTIKADFEGAALSSARILEGRISEIAHNFKESVLHDTSIQTNWNMIISATEKIIEILNNTPGQLDRHIQDKTSALQAAIEVQMGLMAKKFETLSADMSNSQGSVERQMGDAIDKIREHVGVVQNVMSAAVEESAEVQARKYESVLNEIRAIGSEFATMTKSIPQQLTLDMKSAETAIEHVVDKAMRAANSRLDETISSASRSNATLTETLSVLPAKIEDYITSIAPSIAAGINENARRSETRIIEVVKRSVVEGQTQVAQFGPTLDKISREILDIENRLRNALDVNRQGVETFAEKLPDSIKIQIDSVMRDKLGVIEKDIKSSITALVEKQDSNSGTIKDQLQRVLEAVQVSVDLVNGSVSGVTTSVRDLGGSLQDIQGSIKTVGGSLQDIQSSIKTVGGSLNEADSVIASINAVTAQFRDIIDTRVDNVRKAIEGSLSQFDLAFAHHRDVMSHSMTNDLATNLASAQNKLSQDYQAIEERLTRSLSNFNEIVQNCIHSLEESVAWQKDTFNQQMKATAEHNLEAVRAEIEQLTTRLQAKVKEANRGNGIVGSSENVSMPPDMSAHDDTPMDSDADTNGDGPDQELIESLTKKLANIDSILGELRRETTPVLEDEKV